MQDFFNRFKPDDKKKNKNPFAGFKLPGASGGFQGAGQSLGGNLPGKVIPIQLDQPGSLGLKVEKRANSATAIVSMVVQGSQSEKAGLERGDILCFAGSNGSEEIKYDMFLELAKSDQRPICLEVRRVKTKAPVSNDQKSADAFARRQAVIAAAEAREKAHKVKSKPISKVAPEKKKEQMPQHDHDDQPKSEASRLAAQAAKETEAVTAAKLGYNPYETNNATAGQARQATVAVSHGEITGSGEAAPERPLEEAREPTTSEFQQAFESIVSANELAQAQSSMSIMRKLIVNATTKDEAKFRRVRLANAKISAAIVETQGAMDLMLSTGFQLLEEDGEMVLVFPEGHRPDWISSALKQMEKYGESSS
jgi:hypothetical protein